MCTLVMEVLPGRLAWSVVNNHGRFALFFNYVVFIFRDLDGYLLYSSCRLVVSPLSGSLCMLYSGMECNSKVNVVSWKLCVQFCHGGFARELSVESCK